MYKKFRTLMNIASFLMIVIPVGIIAYLEEKFVFADTTKDEHIPKYRERDQ